MPSVGIIGGGAIGLCSAYYLNKAGFDVTVIDQGDMNDGCSFGNAGMIVPSHFIPMAAPGMVSRGIQWMFNSKSPFYVKPRWSPELFNWGFQFYRSATEEHVERSMPALKELSEFSKICYRQMASELPFDFGFTEKGLLMLYRTAQAEKEEEETARIANKIGIKAHVLSPQEVQRLEPDVEVSVRGGIYFPGDAHLTPQLLVRGLIQFLKAAGVKFITGARVDGFEVRDRVITKSKSSNGDLAFDEWLLAAGSWSALLCKKLGRRVPIQAGKGYSFTINDVVRNTRVPSIFTEARVAVTPMGKSLRFGGTLEIGGINSEINMNRVRGITESIPKYYPGLTVTAPAIDQVWHGLRPCSPDGLPYIGRINQFSNLTIASGHAMMGISLAPATGSIVTSLIKGEKPEVEIGMYQPQRFDRN